MHICILPIKKITFAAPISKQLRILLFPSKTTEPSLGAWYRLRLHVRTMMAASGFDRLGQLFLNSFFTYFGSKLLEVSSRLCFNGAVFQEEERENLSRNTISPHR